MLVAEIFNQLNNPVLVWKSAFKHHHCVLLLHPTDLSIVALSDLWHSRLVTTKALCGAHRRGRTKTSLVPDPPAGAGSSSLEKTTGDWELSGPRLLPPEEPWLCKGHGRWRGGEPTGLSPARCLGPWCKLGLQNRDGATWLCTHVCGSERSCTGHAADTMKQSDHPVLVKLLHANNNTVNGN